MCWTVPVPTTVIEIKIQPLEYVRCVVCDFLIGCPTFRSLGCPVHNLCHPCKSIVPESFRDSFCSHLVAPTFLDFANIGLRMVLTWGIWLNLIDLDFIVSSHLHKFRISSNL